jgi:hypothetical protein
MTTKLRAQFDGKTLIPLDPVDLPTGQVLELEVREDIDAATGLRKGSPELLLKVMGQLPKLTKADTDELERMIEEGKMPVRYDGVFDDLK